MFTLGEIAQLQRPYGHADQPQYFDSHGLDHAADLAILAFIQHNFKPAVFLALTQTASQLRP